MHRRPRARLVANLVLAVGATIVGAGTGCMRVPPWQRETLARPTMAVDHDDVAARLDAHVHEYREGAIGGDGVGGGGCGCN